MLSRPAASRMILCCQVATGVRGHGNYQHNNLVFAIKMYMSIDQVKRSLESFLAHKTAVSFLCLHGCKLIHVQKLG